MGSTALVTQSIEYVASCLNFLCSAMELSVDGRELSGFPCRSRPFFFTCFFAREAQPFNFSSVFAPTPSDFSKTDLAIAAAPASILEAADLLRTRAWENMEPTDPREVILPSEALRLFHDRHAMMLGVMLGCTGITQLLGPAVGYQSDRSLSRYGRRRACSPCWCGASVSCVSRPVRAADTRLGGGGPRPSEGALTPARRGTVGGGGRLAATTATSAGRGA